MKGISSIKQSAPRPSLPSYLAKRCGRQNINAHAATLYIGNGNLFHQDCNSEQKLNSTLQEIEAELKNSVKVEHTDKAHGSVKTRIVTHQTSRRKTS